MTQRRAGATGLTKRACQRCGTKTCKTARWRAWYADDTGKEPTRHFERKADAQRWLDEVTASMVTGQYVDPRAGKVTLRDYAAEWQDHQVGGEGSARIVDNALRLHILPQLGDRAIGAFRRTYVQGFIKRLEDRGLSAGHIANIYDVLRRVFAAAVLDKVIAETQNPCVKVSLPGDERGQVAAPAVEHVTELATTVPARYRALVVLLAGSGLRIGEALGLRVADVSVARRELAVRRQRRQNGTLGKTKTPESVRDVPLEETVLDELSAHITRWCTGPDGSPGEWLFTTSTGAPLTYTSWQTVWESAQRPDAKAVRAQPCKRCGASAYARCRTAAGRPAAAAHSVRLDAARGAEMTDTHALRHLYASLMLSAGVSVVAVSQWLGHANPTITLRVYGHFMPGDDERARSAVRAGLAGLRTGCGLADLAQVV